MHFTWEGKINGILNPTHATSCLRCLDPSSTSKIVDIAITEITDHVTLEFLMWPDRNCFFNANIGDIPATLFRERTPSNDVLATGFVSFFINDKEPIRIRVSSRTAEIKEIVSTVDSLAKLAETVLLFRV